MIVNTRLLFLELLRDLRIDTVCDVGSMDGSDALSFRKRLPGAQVIAWEPSPDNLRRMQANPRLAAARVELIGAAASDTDGEAPFFLVPVDSEHRDARRGMSSLYARADCGAAQQTILVRTLRVDAVMRHRIQPDERIALWIDTEGKAFEVLNGARDIVSQVQLVHVEVESTACIGTGQRLYRDVRELLERLDFEELAIDHPHSNPQFNALYLRRGQTSPMMRRVRQRMRRARLRRRLVDGLRKYCPGAAARLAGLRERLLAR